MCRRNWPREAASLRLRRARIYHGRERSQGKERVLINSEKGEYFMIMTDQTSYPVATKVPLKFCLSA